MGDALKRTITTRRHEYVLSSPTPFAEVGKAMTWAHRDLVEAKGEAAGEWDDAVMVEARDDQVVVWWSEEAPS